MPNIALLLTDIEGSTRLLEKWPSAYSRALATHHAILRSCVTAQRGREFQDAGDGFFLAFDEVANAAMAALEIQSALGGASWPEETGPLRVRMAIHWAPAEFREGQYRGPAIHFAARLLSAGHGGQILCSEDAAREIGDALPVRRLGTFRLRGFEKTQAIHQVENGELFPTLRAEQARRHNLPASTDAFVGRFVELRELTALLGPNSGSRLITLTGPGGIGKTRVALAAAERMLDAYENSVIFVGLGDVPDVQAIPFAILAAVDVKAAGGSAAIDLVAQTIGETPTLFVLDNMEQFSSDGGLMVNSLRRVLPLASFLVVSRLPLGVAGEKEFPLGPLTIPTEATPQEVGDCDSAKLFVERAARARFGFAFTPENSPHIANICRRLDGIPLAIELAASRVRVMTARELDQQLELGLSNLSDSSDAAQCQSMEGVFRWSMQLLPPDIALFFGSLSVFRGGWTAEIAAEVGNTDGTRLALAYLQYLLACSLIQAREERHGMRFTMLEPIRQLADAHFDKGLKDAIVRHGSVFRQLARRVNDEVGTDREAFLTEELEPEIANVLAAIEREPRNQERLFSAVDFHEFALHRSCNRRLRSLLTAPTPEGGEVKPETLARAWNAAGALDLCARELDGAKSAYLQAIELFEKCDDQFGATAARCNIAVLAMEQGCHEEAYEVFSSALGYFQDSGAFRSRAAIHTNLSILALRLGRLREARRHIEECLEICRETKALESYAKAVGVLGEIQLAEKDFPGAQETLANKLSLEIELSRPLLYGGVLCCLAEAANSTGEQILAAYYCGAARKHIERHRITLSDWNSAQLDRVEEALSAELGKSAYAQECQKGAGASPLAWLETARAKCRQEKELSLQFPDSQAYQT